MKQSDKSCAKSVIKHEKQELIQAKKGMKADKQMLKKAEKVVKGKKK
jgi:hypothetical protein